MTHVADAVGLLLRQQSMRIHYLPSDPDRHYTVRAPSLLTQLADAVASSSGGRGGRTVPGSRVPLAVDAWQLWQDIVGNVHGWAEALGVDRRPFTAQAREAAARQDITPEWMRRARPWLAPVAWDSPIETPRPTANLAATGSTLAAPVLAAMALDTPGHLDPALPPIGRLLRVTAAAAAGAGEPAAAIAARIAHRASCGLDIAPADCRTGCWYHRAGGILAAVVDDRELRDVACPECSATTALEYRGPVDGERRPEDLYRVPALAVRVAQLDGMGDDDLWVYRICRACGYEGWLDYTTETEGANVVEIKPVMEKPLAAILAEQWLSDQVNDVLRTFGIGAGVTRQLVDRIMTAVDVVPVPASATPGGPIDVMGAYLALPPFPVTPAGRKHLKDQAAKEQAA